MPLLPSLQCQGRRRHQEEGMMQRWKQLGESGRSLVSQGDGSRPACELECKCIECECPGAEGNSTPVVRKVVRPSVGLQSLASFSGDPCKYFPVGRPSAAIATVAATAAEASRVTGTASCTGSLEHHLRSRYFPDDGRVANLQNDRF